MLYRERVAPSVWMYAAGALIIPAVLAVFMPINPVVGVILGIALFAGYCAALYGGSPVIEVSQTTLRVGSAKIPLNLVGDVTPFTDRASAREAAGPGLDARAWICLRGWVATSARIEITDESDPIPYWLISTRAPKEFASAIASARKQQRQRTR